MEQTLRCVNVTITGGWALSEDWGESFSSVPQQFRIDAHFAEANAPGGANARLQIYVDEIPTPLPFIPGQFYNVNTHERVPQLKQTGG